MQVVGDRHRQPRSNARRGQERPCPGLQPDGKILASGGSDRMVRLWDVGTGQELRTPDATYVPHALAFRPDGTMLACGASSPGGALNFWDPATGQSPACDDSQGREGLLRVVPPGRTGVGGRQDGWHSTDRSGYRHRASPHRHSHCPKELLRQRSGRVQSGRPSPGRDRWPDRQGTDPADLAGADDHRCPAEQAGCRATTGTTVTSFPLRSAGPSARTLETRRRHRPGRRRHIRDPSSTACIMERTPISLLGCACATLRTPRPGDGSSISIPRCCIAGACLGMQAADAGDLVQEVLIVLVQKLPEFTDN